MTLVHKPMSIWVLTEHKNATFTINFALPASRGPKSEHIRLTSWSSDDVSRIGLPGFLETLQRHLTAVPPEAVIFSRYVHPHGWEILEALQRRGVTCLFHLDDRLDSIPPAISDRYGAKYDAAYRADLDECLRRADGILTSTSPLADQISHIYPGKPIRRLQGIYYVAQPELTLQGVRSSLARLKRRTLKRTTLTVGYMGTISHERDLLPIVPQIHDLMRRNPAVAFETFGLPVPQSLSNAFPDRTRQFGFSRSYDDFLRTLYELGWDIGLAPLVNDNFNHAKTITKFVEYSACRVPTLAARCEPYSRVPRDAICLASDGDWISEIERLLIDSSIRRQQTLAARRYCKVSASANGATACLIDTIRECSGNAQ